MNEVELESVTMEGKSVFFDESDFEPSPESGGLAGKCKVVDVCQNPKCAEDREELLEIRAERSSVTLRLYLCFFCRFENKYRGAMRRHFRETHDMLSVEAPNESHDTEETDDINVESSPDSVGANDDKLHVFAVDQGDIGDLDFDSSSVLQEEGSEGYHTVEETKHDPSINEPMSENTDCPFSSDDNITLTGESDIKDRKLLFKGQTFSSYGELERTIRRFEYESRFRICIRGSKICDRPDIDKNRFPKKSIQYVCQLGQRVRVRLKSETRQRRAKNSTREKTGCPVNMYVRLNDSDLSKAHYVIMNFNYKDHNHPPRNQLDFERPKRDETKSAEKIQLCENSTVEEAKPDLNNHEPMSEDTDIHHSADDESGADKTQQKIFEGDLEDEKVLCEGQVFSSYEELQNVVGRYESKYRFKLCVRGSDVYDGPDLDAARFPKRRIQYVCQLGQRERVRLKAETRQRRAKNSTTEKTGCPVRMNVHLRDSNLSKASYVITKFNHEDHNHPPLPQPEVGADSESPKRVKMKSADKVKLCENCGYSAASSADMRAHVESKHAMKHCPMEGCHFTSLSHADVTRHVMCSANHRAVCSICNYVPGRGRTLNDHKCQDYLGKITRDNQMFSCPECPFKSKRKGNIKIHCRTVHGLREEHRCEPCQVKFERVTELRRHREDVHLGKARLFCEVEGCKFHTCNAKLFRKHTREDRHGRRVRGRDGVTAEAMEAGTWRDRRQRRREEERKRRAEHERRRRKAAEVEASLQ